MGVVALYGLPIVFAVLVWWLSTGVVLLVVSRPRRSYAWSMIGATVLLLVGLYGLAWSSGETTVTGAYVAFSSALLVWAWHETSFLTGLVTGPRTIPAEAPLANGRAPLRSAIETLLYHEIAILLTGVVISAITIGEANQVGLWTFVVLWVMRLSAKLNVYLGVPNLTEEFLPEHLAYLKGYFCRKPMNLLFPISVTASTAVTVLLVEAALAPGAGAFEVTGSMLLATFLALAVIEHWFLVIPFRSAELWRWGLRAGQHTAEDQSAQADARTPDRRNADRVRTCPVTVTT